jgi:hypothetical protein
MTRLVVLMAISMVLGTTAARAERRFALVVGHNRGTADEVPLRYADNDARRMAETLRAVGGVNGDDLVLMTDDGDSAEDVLRALAGLEQRLRGVEDAVLIVYYSGHADSSALHLGEHRLALTTLDERLQQSAARVRLLVVDACRSGSLTRVKGTDEPLRAAGYAVITASAAAEDAAEADDVQGSYFTHALVSGVRGAADDNGDGAVTLAEAFRHAYDATVLRTARAQSGVQHPTFRHELRGHEDVVLARLDTDLAYVVAPSDVDVILSLAGRVVAEVGRGDARRSVALAPGPYDVIVRGDEVVYQGVVEVNAHQSTLINIADLDGAGYARLVRKGSGDKPLQWGISAAAYTGFHHVGLTGGEVAVPLVWRFVTVTPRLGLGFGGAETDFYVPGRTGEVVRPTNDQLQQVRATVSAGPVFDIGPVSFGVAAIVGLEGVALQSQTLIDGRFVERDPAHGVGALAGSELTMQITLFERFFIDSGVQLHAGTLAPTFGNLGAVARVGLGLWQ